MPSSVRPDLAGSLVVEDGEVVLIPMPPPRDVAGESHVHRAAAIRVVGPEVRIVGPEVRIVGPGRRERGYQERIRELSDELARAGKALAVAECIEHGAVRRSDRMEREVARVTESERELRQAQHRLILALGALQRENEVLRRSLSAGGRAALPAAAHPREPSRWSRVVSALSRRFRRAVGRA